jgi:hypothetical protein
MTLKVLLVLAASLGLTSGALAYEEEGWFIYGTGHYVEPTNADHYLANLEKWNGDQEVERLLLDYSGDLAVEAGFGYSWGKLGRLTFSFWDFSDTESLDESYGYDYNLNDTFQDNTVYGPLEICAEGEIKASWFAVNFERDFDIDDPWTLTWKVGLRFVDFEDMLELDAYNTEYPDDEFIWAGRKLEMDGYGATVGIGGAHHFNDLVSLVGNLDVTYALGESDNYLFETSYPGEMQELESHQDVSGLITDLRAGFLFRGVAEGLNLGIFMTHSSWDDMVTDFTTGAEEPFDDHTLPTRDNVSFTGISFYIRYLFGKD